MTRRTSVAPLPSRVATAMLHSSILLSQRGILPQPGMKAWETLLSEEDLILDFFVSLRGELWNKAIVWANTTPNLRIQRIHEADGTSVREESGEFSNPVSCS